MITAVAASRPAPDQTKISKCGWSTKDCTRHRHTDDCPDGCTRPGHVCPKPCPKGCTGHARTCPQRKGGGLVLAEPKSDKGKRTVALPKPLVAALRAHHTRQAAEKLAAGAAWEDHDLVWCQPNGRPIDPRKDWAEWRELLEAAKVGRLARLHDARHTAATLLLAQGVDQRTVMEILGHSQISMTTRYQHVLPEVMNDAAERMERALWGMP